MRPVTEAAAAIILLSDFDKFRFASVNNCNTIPFAWVVTRRLRASEKNRNGSQSRRIKYYTTKTTAALK